MTLVLKGWRTLIAHPDSRLAINITGRRHSGNILTAILAAMVGQFPSSRPRRSKPQSISTGLAADFAVREQDEHTLLAMDTVNHLYQAFRFRAEDRGGYLWVQGIPGMFKERE